MEMQNPGLSPTEKFNHLLAERNEADLSVCRKYVRQRFLWSRGISYDLDSNEEKKKAEEYIFFASNGIIPPDTTHCTLLE